MSAQEQMKKILDELMGTSRDGEYKGLEISRSIYKQCILLYMKFYLFNQMHVSVGNRELTKQTRISYRNNEYTFTIHKKKETQTINFGKKMCKVVK